MKINKEIRNNRGLKGRPAERWRETARGDRARSHPSTQYTVAGRSHICSRHGLRANRARRSGQGSSWPHMHRHSTQV